MAEDTPVAPCPAQVAENPSVAQGTQAAQGSLPDAAALVARVAEVLDGGIARVLEAFDRKLAYDAHKDQLVDRLHAELQESKRNLLTQATRPLVLGLIQLHDSFGKTLDALRSEAQPPSPERLFQALEGAQTDVELLLEQQGVQPFREPDAAFVPRRQTALRTVDGPPDSANLVANRVRPGFECGTEVIRKERVVVYRASSAATAAAGPSAARPAAQPAGNRPADPSGTSSKGVT